MDFTEAGEENEEDIFVIWGGVVPVGGVILTKHRIHKLYNENVIFLI